MKNPNPSPPASEAAFHLRDLEDSDFDAVKALWHRRFGGKDETMDNWLNATQKPKWTATGHVAVANGAVVGFGLVEIGSHDYTARYLGVEPLDLNVPLDDRNGILHMYAVEEAWEGRGVGTALYARHLEHLVEHDVPHAYGVSWHRPHRNGADSRALFEKFGFDRVGAFERYYARSGERLHCPDCEGDCQCTASIYHKPLNGE